MKFHYHSLLFTLNAFSKKQNIGFYTITGHCRRIFLQTGLKRLHPTKLLVVRPWLIRTFSVEGCYFIAIPRILNIFTLPKFIFFKPEL